MRSRDLTAFILFATLLINGCQKSPDVNQNRDLSTRSSSRSPDTTCLKGLPSTSAEQAAASAVNRHDTRLYRYLQIGGEAGDTYLVAGYEACSGRALEVPGHSPFYNSSVVWSDADYKRDTIELLDRGKERDYGPMDQPCIDCVAPLSACGKQRVAYGARYNRELFRLKGRAYRPYCSK